MSTSPLYLPDTFDTREPQHAEALEQGDRVFERYGFEPGPSGIEHYSRKFRAQLYYQNDRTSRLLRHAPDRIYTCRGNRSVYVETKAQSGTYPNFSLAVDSYESAVYHEAALVFADMGDERLAACFAEALPLVELIYVPKRWDWRETWERLEQDWPDARLKEKPHHRGSGQAYILVPKCLPILRPLGAFINRKLLP
jgi:hypothetical protein